MRITATHEPSGKTATTTVNTAVSIFWGATDMGLTATGWDHTGSFGTDAFATDPLTHLRLTNNGYIEAIEMLHASHPRILALGGGGYNMSDVERGWTLLWSELAGIPLEETYGGSLGGVFLGDASLPGSNLRDMHAYTTGPEKERLAARAGELIDNYRKGTRPLLA